MRGIYVVVEGIDGTGKTSLVSLLEHTLRERGYKVLTIKEPISTMFFNHNVMHHVLQSQLFTEARFYTYTFIDALLNEGYIVLSDRNYRSMYAYQLSLNLAEQDMKILATLYDISYEKYSSIESLTILCETDIESINKILNSRGEEEYSKKFFNKLTQRYNELDWDYIVNPMEIQTAQKLIRAIELLYRSSRKGN